MVFADTIFTLQVPTTCCKGVTLAMATSSPTSLLLCTVTPSSSNSNYKNGCYAAVSSTEMLIILLVVENYMRVFTTLHEKIYLKYSIRTLE